MENDTIRFRMIKERHKNTFEEALKQGKMDKEITPICQFLSGTKNYYSSSSCSGRIILLEKQGERKIDNYFHRKWHRTIKKEELIEGLNAETKGDLWLKTDPFILHAGTENLENAKKIIKAMKKAGIKRGGITVAENGKFIIEILGTETLALPVKKGKKILIEKEYAELLIKTANELLEKNFKRLKKLEKEFRLSLD